jgi:hypothetical protein
LNVLVVNLHSPHDNDSVVSSHVLICHGDIPFHTPSIQVSCQLCFLYSEFQNSFSSPDTSPLLDRQLANISSHFLAWRCILSQVSLVEQFLILIESNQSSLSFMDVLCVPGQAQV